MRVPKAICPVFCRTSLRTWSKRGGRSTSGIRSWSSRTPPVCPSSMSSRPAIGAGGLARRLDTHGQALHSAALMTHQRCLMHCHTEPADRNRITFSPRAVLGLIGTGRRDQPIAQLLDLSVSAVRQRRNALMQSPGTDKRVALAALAMSPVIVPDPLGRPRRLPETARPEMEATKSSEKDRRGQGPPSAARVAATTPAPGPRPGSGSTPRRGRD